MSLAQRVLAAAAAAWPSPAIRRGAWALLAGGLAFLVFGTTPTRVSAPADAAPDWALPQLAASAPVSAWPAPVWRSEPAPVALVETHAAQPRLLGVVRVGAALRGVFVMADGRRVRAGAGERLPDGAEITALAPTRAAWRDAEGRVHDARLLDARRP